MSEYTGSDFDDFLKEEGILEAVTTKAHKRLLALQLDGVAKAPNTNKVHLNDIELLLCEIAGWEAASDEATLKIEKLLTEEK